jgi:hypothetical protein
MYGLFSALVAVVAFALPFHSSAQDAPDAGPGQPLDLTRPEARAVNVEIARRVLMGPSDIVEMGFDPALPAEFSSDAGTATVRVRGADVVVVAPLFDPLMAGPASAAITGAQFVMQGDLVLTIDRASGATEIEQQAMGMAMISLQIGALRILTNEPLNFGVMTRGSTSRGPLTLATIGAADPMGGPAVRINGAACAPVGSPFERDAMLFGLARCDSLIMVNGQPEPQFTNQQSVAPVPFDAATGTVITVGNQVIAIADVLGQDLPDAARFNRDLSAFRITERSGN